MSQVPTGICDRQLTALAVEEGNIQAISERKISASTNPLLARIRQGQYKEGMGANLRRIRYSVAPTEDREYLRLDDHQADEAGKMPGRGGDSLNSDLDTTVNGRGGQCDIPGETLYHGFDEFGREAFIKAFETDPICALTLQSKGPEHINALTRMLRDQLPMVAQEQYEYAVERAVWKNGKYLVPATQNAFEYATGKWPAKPNSGLTYGMCKRAQALQVAEGWTGQFEVMISSEAFERLRHEYKKQYQLTLESALDSSETHDLPDGTQTVMLGNIRFVILDKPPRGYLQPLSGGGYEFVRIHNKIARAGTGGGVVWDINPSYFNCVYEDGNGGVHEIYEVGFFVHPTAAERQSYAPSQIMDHKFKENIFNMSVKMLQGTQLECNKDEFKFAYRLLHAWGFQTDYHERMGAFLYQIAPDEIGGFNPCVAETTVTPEDITAAEAQPTEHDECSLPAEDDIANLPCVDGTPQHATQTAGAGSIRLLVPPATTVDSGTLTVCAERIGGNDGALTADVATVDGTAVSGTDYTQLPPTAVAFADGEKGRKCVDIVIDPTGAGGVSFDVTLDTVVVGAVGIQA